MVSLLVTVGSTSFPALTDYICQQQTLEILSQLDISSIVIQYGTYIPNLPATTNDSPSINMFAYTPCLSDFMKSADIIISHAGAGTLLEACSLRKHTIAVVNDTLMDNHQIELARALEHQGCCSLVCDHLRTNLLTAIRHQLELLSNHKLPSPPPSKQINGFIQTMNEELNILH